MKVIAVASQKGGSGKTTLAGHLAVQAEMAGGGPVALVDTDPQGSLSEWWNEREAETPLFARTTVERLAADIGRMEQMGINLLFVDTPPAITSTIANVIGLADLLIIPTRPSPHDLRAVGATVELAEGLDTPLIFVVNGATPRARITSEAAIALSQHGTLAPSIIHQRVDFASSMIDGRTTMELNPSSRSSDEITKLWAYIDERLSRMESKHAIPTSPHLSAASASNGAAYN
jgi:chromosome partitioning protein